MKKTIFFVIIILILLALVWEIFISPIFNEVVVQDELVFDFPDEEIVEQPIIVIGSETEDSESKTEKTPDLETSSENNTTNRPALSPKKEIEPTTKTTKPAQSGTTLPTQTLTQLQVQVTVYTSLLSDTKTSCAAKTKTKGTTTNSSF